MELKGFIELTRRWYNSKNNEYKPGNKFMVNVNHIFIIGDKFIKTIEDVREEPTLCVESYEQIINLIDQATRKESSENIQDYI